MIWVLLVGCGLGLESDPVDNAPVETLEPGTVEWTVEPATLALGETPVDQPISGTITLMNTGDEDLLVLDLGDARTDGIEVSLSEAPLIAPGSSTPIQVVWTPVEPGVMDSTLSISVGASPEEAQPVTVPVGGTALGANATLSMTYYDFGEVDIGCQGELELTLTNTGNAEMVVDAVDLEGADGFSLDEPDDLPWELGPYQSHEVGVLFSPDDIGGMVTELSFDTDVGEISAELQGQGVVDEERTQTFDVGEQSRSTIIVDVNLTAIPNSSEDQYSQFFVAALPTFFETLLENHSSFRAGFVWSTSGTVDGEYDYIDETFTAEEATNAALEMIAPGANGGDNDQNFVTLLAALSANSDWLFEDAGWSESLLSLITIQRDTEASGGSWENWVAQTQAFKEDPEDVVFHAIAGPMPSGCGSAEPFADYDKAVDATGGLFLSVCASDWTEHMAQLATAALEGAPGIFQLDGTPMASSIEVYVDGFRTDDGWSYDESLNAVVFEEDSYPEFESVVTINYWMSDGCD